jgi:hypothetical protein
MPEACDPGEYSAARPLAERGIGVLEIGRRLATFHDAVRGRLAAEGIRHVFSHSADGARQFPDQASLHAALGDSVISVCFPRSLTHPELAGGLETVTLRYFESIASGCVVLGRCPAELQELFGYSPVLQADTDDPLGQVRAILADPGAHQASVDRNRARLTEVATWAVRARQMLRMIKDCGVRFQIPLSS